MRYRGGADSGTLAAHLRPPMNFLFAEAMCDPNYYLPLAVAAEEAGYRSYVVPDNLGKVLGRLVAVLGG